MYSSILSTAVRFMLPLLLVYSVFILFRGHNLPGGGFIGGLVAAAAFSLYAISDGVQKAKQAIRFEPLQIAATGLSVSMIAGFIGYFSGLNFLQGVWYDITIPVMGKLGTPVLFDVGVYLVVIGITLKIILTLADEQ